MSFRTLSRNAIASTLSVLGSALLFFELYRFLASELTPAGIGIWSLVMAITSTVRLGDFGLGSGVVKFVAGDLGANQAARAAATVCMTAAAIAVFMALICWLLFPVIGWIITSVLPPGESRETAMGLIPWVQASLWLTVLANVFAGAVDGAQRTQLRVYVALGAGAFQIIVAWWLVPQWGLAGMGPVQFLYALAMVIGMFVATVIVLRQPLTAWFRWRMDRARELFRYGASVQIAALAEVSIDPVIKWLLGLFGSMELLGYFEMAQRAVTQLRQAVVAAFQMVVPYLSTRIGRDGLEEDAIRRSYRRAWRLLITVTIPYFAAIGCAFPVFLTIWIGRHDPDFVLIGIVCLAGWFVNTSNVPAYMFYLAIGRLRWTVLTQATIAALSVIFAVTGGALFGGLGVVFGAMIARALGSWVVIVAFHREYQISARGLVSAQDFFMFIFGVLSVFAALAGNAAWQSAEKVSIFSLAPLALFATVALMHLWKSPVRKQLIAAVAER